MEKKVAPLVGAWIEMMIKKKLSRYCLVAPLVGAWIEIMIVTAMQMDGLHVAPLVGAWIEIPKSWRICDRQRVAPLVGAWIEIFFTVSMSSSYTSLPSWERGLKFFIGCFHFAQDISRSPRGSVD